MEMREEIKQEKLRLERQRNDKDLAKLNTDYVNSLKQRITDYEKTQSMLREQNRDLKSKMHKMVT